MPSAPLGPPTLETLTAKQRARRAKIVDAAMRLLLNGDLASVKVTEVAKRANVALGTVYRYFNSKEHLFAAVYIEWQAAYRRHLERHPIDRFATSEEERLREFMHGIVRAFEAQPQFYELALKLTMTDDPYSAQAISSALVEFREVYDVALGMPEAPDPDCEAIYRTVSAVLNDNLTSWIHGRISITEVYGALTDSIRLIYGPGRRKGGHARSLSQAH